VATGVVVALIANALIGSGVTGGDDRQRCGVFGSEHAEL